MTSSEPCDGERLTFHHSKELSGDILVQPLISECTDKRLMGQHATVDGATCNGKLTLGPDENRRCKIKST